MISLEKLIVQLQNCKDTQIRLPQANETSPLIQKTAIDIRKAELQSMKEKSEKLGASVEMYEEVEKQGNFTMSDEFKSIEGAAAAVPTKRQDVVIPPKSLIVYSESECAALPEVLTNVFNVLCKGQQTTLKANDWYIYGVKNPESFYKSILLLVRIDFIIKNRTEKKNEVATFKREMAFQYENFYRTLDYQHRYHFSKANMVNNLTNVDNYTGIDIFQYICDYTKTNMIVLDVIEEQYIDLQWNECAGLTSDFKNIYKGDYICIVKYANNTYLPLMNMSGSHALGVEFVSYVKDNFERMKFRGFVKSINEGECDGEDMKALPSNTVKVISLDEPEEYVQINKIIDNEECRVDESLIVVVEQEDVFESRLNNAQLKSLEYKEPKYNLELGKDNTTATNAVSSFDSNSDLDLEKRVFGSNPISLEKLMDKIPTVKSVKTAKTAKLQQPRKSPTVKTEQQKTVAIETVIQKQEKEELKPLKKYTLLDLQQLSRLHKLPTQKDGTSGKKINKTKEELYTELQKVF